MAAASPIAVAVAVAAHRLVLLLLLSLMLPLLLYRSAPHSSLSTPVTADSQSFSVVAVIVVRAVVVEVFQIGGHNENGNTTTDCEHQNYTTHPTNIHKRNGNKQTDAICSQQTCCQGR